ncbi:MAG: hypothetical protein LBD55_03790 [Treponema sp.]|nr:hypothetical protein [Treponema sp.]
MTRSGNRRRPLFPALLRHGLPARSRRNGLGYHYEPMKAGELREAADSWLDKYHFYRPHESLNFLTPAEFSATLGLSIPRTGVSYEYGHPLCFFN